MIFDIILFGIILTIYETYQDKKKEVQQTELEKRLRITQLNNEINDFRYWCTMKKRLLGY